MKSEPKYLACERISNTLLNSFLFFCCSTGFYGGLTSLLFFLSKAPAVGCVQHLFMHLAPQVCTLRRASHVVSCPDPFRKNQEGVWQHSHTVPCPRGIQSVTQPRAKVYICSQNQRCVQLHGLCDCIVICQFMTAWR